MSKDIGMVVLKIRQYIVQQATINNTCKTLPNVSLLYKGRPGSIIIICNTGVLHFLSSPQHALDVLKVGNAVKRYGKNVSVNVQDGTAAVNGLLIQYVLLQILLVQHLRNHLISSFEEPKQLLEKVKSC